MILYLLLTALTVSIDSFVCGFSLSTLKGKKIIIVMTIASIVFIMCLFTNYLTLLFQNLDENAGCFGGVVLILIGIFNFFRKEKSSTKGGIFSQSLVAGLAVGIDGALANLSLALMGINAFYVPLIIAIMHGIMIYLGLLLAGTLIAKKVKIFNIIAPLCLILLGAYKLMELFT